MRRSFGPISLVEMRDDATLDPGEIALDTIDRETHGLQDGRSSIGLPNPDLGSEHAAGGKQRREVLGNPQIGGKTVPPPSRARLGS